MEGQDQLKELTKQVKKLNREKGRLQAELEILKGLNEQVTSAQKYIQQENRRQICYNEQLLRTFPYILIMVDDNLNTVMVSDAFLRISGVNRDEIKEGMPLRDAVSYIVPEEKIDPFIKKCRNVIENAQNRPSISNEENSGENMLNSVIDGKERNLQYDISYFLEERDDVRGLSIIFSDLTEIVEAKERAINADKAKSRFLAQMSHEIRTPINAVLGMNEMILRESGDKAILEYAGNIDSAGRTLLSLINSILDFSKIEDGKMEIVPVKYDTSSFINDLYHSIIQRADAKGLSFVMDVDKNLPCTMVGDDVRFAQIIMNLLTNAVKYTERGSVTLSLHTAEIKANKVRLAVAVCDTGIGIREEDREKLFEAFERLDEVKNHNIEGTGLGIAIVTNLLGMMGSKLRVESIYGQGSTFSFVIEQEVSDGTPIGDYEKRLKESGTAKDKDELIYAPGAKVLVVDDNEMNMKVARNLLKLCGIKPEEAYSGVDTIDLMRKNTYDIVLLDHMMPGMDGIETLDRLKEEVLIPEGTAMIVLTANAVVGAREKYLEAGFSDYLSKPMEIKHLVEKLAQYLPKRAYRANEWTGSAYEVHPLGENTRCDAVSDEAGNVMEFEPEEEDEFMEFAPVEEDGLMEFEPEEEDGVKSYENAGKNPEYDLDILKNSGMDVDAGLNYCAGDQSMYFELLRDFMASYKEKLVQADRLYLDGDWHEYEVAVHALKSNAKLIGATSASKLAKELEEAAAGNDTGFIEKHHEMLLSMVRDVADMVRSGDKTMNNQ